MNKYYDNLLEDQFSGADIRHPSSPKPIKIPDPDRLEQDDEDGIDVNSPDPVPMPPHKPTLGQTARSQIVLAYVAFTRIFSRWGSEFIEFQSSLTAAILGTWLMFPSTEAQAADLFYAALARLAPPLVLGSVVMLLGVTQFVALVSHHWRLRRITALTASALWTFFAVLFALSGLAIGTPVHAVQAVLTAWVYLRLGRLKI